jgi:glutamate decarboxylase
VELNPLFSRPGESSVFPRFTIPDGESLPSTAYQVVHDEAMLDGNSRLNLATFVGTWMEAEASKLYAETFDKNMIDKDEYPQTALIETRCWRMLSDLWNAPDAAKTVGTSTIGSSEACMLLKSVPWSPSPSGATDRTFRSSHGNLPMATQRTGTSIICPNGSG